MDFSRLRLPDALLDIFKRSRPKPEKPGPEKDTDMGDVGTYTLVRMSNYYDWMQRELTLSPKRLERYADFDNMDQDPIIQQALDQYAEEATLWDIESNATNWFESKDKEIKEEGEEFLRLIHWEDIATSVARNVAKYGDDFHLIFFEPPGLKAGKENPAGAGITQMDRVQHPKLIKRLEDDRGVLKGFDREGVKPAHSTDPAFHPWDVNHWRLRHRMENGMYGDSILEPARWVYKRLQMQEDCMLIYRIQRAPDRTIYYVDVGQVTPEKAYDIIRRWRRKSRKNVFIDPSTGETKMVRNPLAVEEDMYWPVGKDSQSRIDRLTGSANVGDITDIEFTQDKLYVAVGVPKGFLGGDAQGMGWNPKETLAKQDLRFAVKVRKVKRAVIVGLSNSFVIHYAIKHNRVLTPQVDFRILGNVIHTEDELNRLTVIQTKLEIASRFFELGTTMLIDPHTLRVYCLSELMGFSADDIELLSKKMTPSPMGPPPGSPGAGPGGVGGYPESAEAVDRLKARLQSDPEAQKRMKELIEWVRSRSAVTAGQASPDKDGLDIRPGMIPESVGADSKKRASGEDEYTVYCEKCDDGYYFDGRKAMTEEKCVAVARKRGYKKVVFQDKDGEEIRVETFK